MVSTVLIFNINKKYEKNSVGSGDFKPDYFRV